MSEVDAPRPAPPVSPEERIMARPVLTEQLSKYALPTAQFDGLCLEVRDAGSAAWVLADPGGNEFCAFPAPY
jgi:hypothetical protein